MGRRFRELWRAGRLPPQGTSYRRRRTADADAGYTSMLSDDGRRVGAGVSQSVTCIYAFTCIGIAGLQRAFTCFRALVAVTVESLLALSRAFARPERVSRCSLGGRCGGVDCRLRLGVIRHGTLRTEAQQSSGFVTLWGHPYRGWCRNLRCGGFTCFGITVGPEVASLA